jgi:hypothetical protein
MSPCSASWAERTASRRRARLLHGSVCRSPAVEHCRLTWHREFGERDGQAAGHLIDDASIKNASIAGAKLKPHPVSGLQIDMSRLGTVPRAAAAGSAPPPTTLPHHQSLTGLYAVEGTGPVNQTAVSFVIPLATAPVAHFIAPGGPVTLRVSGYAAAPAGTARHLVRLWV